MTQMVSAESIHRTFLFLLGIGLGFLVGSLTGVVVARRLKRRRREQS